MQEKKSVSILSSLSLLRFLRDCRLLDSLLSVIEFDIVVSKVCAAQRSVGLGFLGTPVLPLG